MTATKKQEASARARGRRPQSKELRAARDALYREHGVRMNCVSPGPMETAMMTDFRIAMSDKILDGVAAASTLGRMAPPSDVSPAVLFLASDAAAFCCGTIFDVDGGWTAVTATDQVDYSVFA